MKKRGFTLIELMVTITIMMIMTSVVLFNYNRFNDSTLLNSFAYDLSLTIRQAQVYGVATKEVSGTNQGDPISVSSVNNFNNPYGVHFDSTPGATPLVLFVDNGDKIYKTDGTDTVLQSYSFQRGIKIKQICALDIAGNCKPATTLDITFVRPNPEAAIYFDGVATQSAGQIVLQDANSTITKSVVVESTGQISVQ